MNGILLTGSDGGVGTTVRRLLQARGWSVRSFDLSSGQNLLDEEAVLRAAEGCGAVVREIVKTCGWDSDGLRGDLFVTRF